jgi:hypothetical protein
MKAEKILLDKNPKALDRPSDLPYAEIMKLDEAHTEQVIQRLISEAGKNDTDLLLDQGAVDWKVELAIKILSTTTASIPHVALRLKTGDPGNLLRLIKKRGQTPSA